MSSEIVVERGWLAPALAGEHPGLGLLSCGSAIASTSAEPGVRARLESLADRLRGAQALELRREPVPAAYRVFYRHIGIDPDVTRTPVEREVLDRLLHGGLRSRGRIADALTLAVLETGVAVDALDEVALAGALGLRPAGRDERLGAGPGARPLRPGRIVVADGERALYELFGALPEGVAPHRRTRSLRLVAVQVPGVPSIHVEEALWIAHEALGR